jgi:hypothetical protein
MTSRDMALLALLGCLGSGLAGADDRFYQIVDPDGHVRTVKVPVAGTSGEDKATAAAPAATAEPAAAPAAAAAPASAAPAAAAPAATVAPYDSDVYTDSETLDGPGANPEKKKRFIIINDSTGSHVQHLDDEGAAPEPESVKAVPATTVAMTELPDESREWAAPDLFRQFPALERCLSAKDRKQATELKPGRQLPVLIDGRTRVFIHDLGLVSAYRLDGAGVKTVVVRSYAGADMKPGFARPYLAFAGRDGCLTRMLTGYYQRRAGTTQSRHGMLEGSVVMHDDEGYLLVLMPDDRKYDVSPPTTYALSADGQLSIKWQP